MRRHNKRSEWWPAAAVTLQPGAEATPQELRDCVKQRVGTLHVLIVGGSYR